MGTPKFVDYHPGIDREYLLTRDLGFIDAGHADPTNARGVLKDITEGTRGCAPDDWFLVRVSQENWLKGPLRAFGAGVYQWYLVRGQLTPQQVLEVGLPIFMRLSVGFEYFQFTLPARLGTSSGFSSEDLVSDLVGFYRAAFPCDPDPILLASPQPAALALKTWNAMNVGKAKNFNVLPIVYRSDGCGNITWVPAPLPHYLRRIRPAELGGLFKVAPVGSLAVPKLKKHALEFLPGIGPWKTTERLQSAQKAR